MPLIVRTNVNLKRAKEIQEAAQERSAADLLRLKAGM